jgi:MFS transporter, ACS family, tartrate transporter
VLWCRRSDRHGERSWHVIIACLFSATGALVASIAQSNFVLLPALAAAAIGMNSAFAPFYTLAPLFLRGPAMAGGFAFVSSIGTLLGGFLGQYVLGVIRQMTGGYSVPLATMAAAITAAAVIVLLLDRAIQTRPAPAVAPAE